MDRRRGEAFFEQVAALRALLPNISMAAAVVVLGSATYGFTFGLWRSSLLASYVAIKLPALLVATTSLVMLLDWIIAHLAASGLGFWQVAALTGREIIKAVCMIVESQCAFRSVRFPNPTVRPWRASFA